MKIFRQNGAILLLMLIMLLLAITTVVISAINDRHDIKLLQQQQTQRSLHQAKQALIGFAAGYDQTHSDTINFGTGYLPCPDITGDGSANPPCANKGRTVLGRFPWRTLGLPPLYDGSGECLWYAVSGSYKDNPKQLITSSTDGDIIVKDVNGNILNGNDALNRAIAVVFAPNKPLKNQIRSGSASSGTQTVCGHKNQKNAELNQASNYLETISNINNATGGGVLVGGGTSNRIFYDSDADDEQYPTFVQATTTYNSDGEEIFNDALIVITPQDFAPVYKLMDYRVIAEAMRCIEGYFSNNRTNSFNTYSIPIGNENSPAIDTFRNRFEADITQYVNEMISNCQYSCWKNESCSMYCTEANNQCLAKCGEGDITCQSQCTTEQTQCETDCVTDKNNCQTECTSTNNQNKHRGNAIDITANYPWAVALSDATFKEQTGQRFGRIPSILSTEPIDTNPIMISHTINADMANNWSNECFNEHNWAWWEAWKDKIFYTLDDDYQPYPDTLIWIKTARQGLINGTDWILEDWNNYKAREMQRKSDTLSKLTDSTLNDGWEQTTMPTTVADLTLSGASRNFMLIAAGRRLALNETSTLANYEAFTQVQDDKSFCATYPLSCATCTCVGCTAEPYAIGCYKSRIDNYLEGDAHSTLNLRTVHNGAMFGGNIPIDYNTQPVASVPSGDEAFIEENLDIQFFTDYACYSTWNCKQVYKKD